MAKKEEETVQIEIAIEDMPLTSIREYRLYNEAARKENKRLRKCTYPIKQCPVELHPKQTIKISNNDHSQNAIPVFISNHLIHFDEKLIPGKTYDLPECIVHYLGQKGYPIWGYVTTKDGAKESIQVGTKNRFSINTVYKE